MDKSTRFQMRIDTDLLAAIDAKADAEGMTRTGFIIAALRQRLAPTLDGPSAPPPNKVASGAPSYRQVDRPTYDGISAGIPRSPAPTIHATTYRRPKHDATCRCMLCKLSVANSYKGR